MNYRTLKARHRKEREAYPENLSLRLHRALSWLDRAERSTEDRDAQFIFLWIAFNAAYADEFDVDVQLSEQLVFSRFLKQLCDLDRGNLLYGLIWSEFAGSIRVLLDNKYVFKPFWEYQRGHIKETQWEDAFKKANESARRALAKKDTYYVLKVVFARLYTLRNQLLHGGSTWNGKVNRDQIRDGANILGKLVPAVVTIMMDNPGNAWGEPCYPVVS